MKIWNYMTFYVKAKQVSIRRFVAPKFCYFSTSKYGVTTYRIIIYIVTALNISNLLCLRFFV
jgi:hypothetical protein